MSPKPQHKPEENGFYRVIEHAETGMGEKSFGLLNHLAKQVTSMEERLINMAVCQEKLRNEIGSVSDKVKYVMALICLVGSGIIGALTWFFSKLPWEAMIKAALK